MTNNNSEMPKNIWLRDDDEPEHTWSAMAYHVNPKVESPNEYKDEVFHTYTNTAQAIEEIRGMIIPDHPIVDVNEYNQALYSSYSNLKEKTYDQP